MPDKVFIGNNPLPKAEKYFVGNKEVTREEFENFITGGCKNAR